MRRLVLILGLAMAALFAACDTDPATNVSYFEATLQGDFKCGTYSNGVYTADVQFQLRQTGGTFGNVGPVHQISCNNEAGTEKDVPATQATGLKHNTTYQFRLHTADGDYDADGTKNGTNYDAFTTPEYPTLTTKSAKAFNDAIGINTRTAFSDAHGNLTNVRAALDYMGIRHCRDSLWPEGFDAQRDFLRSLGAAGITCSLSPHFFGSPGPIGTCDLSHIDQFVSRLENDAALRAVLDRVDSTNEPSNDESVQQCMRTYQQELYESIKGSPLLADRPVLAPSLFANTTTVGDISAWTDFGNFHPYPNAFPPESEQPGAALQWNIDNICHAHTPEPCQATEWGYHTDLSETAGHLGVSEAVRPSYTLRGLLELYRRGIVRTDLYTIVSGSCTHGNGIGGESGDFGFYDCNWNKLPVADAMHNLTTTLGLGTSSTPLHATIDSAPANLRSQVFRRADGSYAILVYRNQTLWNRDTKQETDNPVAGMSMTVPDATSVAYVDVLNSATEVPLTLDAAHHFSMIVSGRPVILLVK